MRDRKAAARLLRAFDKHRSWRFDQEASCRQRRDMDMWFSADPRQAHLGARLADAVVAAARRQGSLPFRLRCTPYPADIPYWPQCALDVPRTTASIDPRAILEIRECHEKPGPECISVQLA